MTHGDAAIAHDRRGGLMARIEAALRAEGKDPGRLTVEDLVTVDQFHTGGRTATMELARLADVRPGTRVVDVGGGIGGAARLLASAVGCTVDVVDLAPEYCAVGRALTERTGLADRVRFHVGDALALPFGDATADIVWTQHGAMSIRDRERMYAELARVLRPGGRLAMDEIMAGPVQPIHFPVPWAAVPQANHLRAPEEVRRLLQEAGLVQRAWLDLTGAAIEWLRSRLAATAGGPLPPGLHVLLDSQRREAFSSLLRNLVEHRVVAVQAVFGTPA